MLVLVDYPMPSGGGFAIPRDYTVVLRGFLASTPEHMEENRSPRFVAVERPSTLQEIRQAANAQILLAKVVRVWACLFLPPKGFKSQERRRSSTHR